MKQKRAKESIKGKKSDSFPPDLLAILPKKVAAAIKDVPESVARKKLPDALALYLQKVTQKLEADLVSDVSHVFSHLKNRGADDFQEGSIAKELARDGKISSAILSGALILLRLNSRHGERWKRNKEYQQATPAKNQSGRNLRHRFHAATTG